MTDSGLIPTQQAPASTIATVEVGDRPVTELWGALFDHVDVVETFVRAVRDLASGLTVPDLYDELEERDVPYWLRSRIRDVARGDRHEAWHLGADIAPTVGQGHSTVDDVIATAGLFDALEGETPTVAFVVDREFERADRRTRTKVCRLIATLSRAFDVRFVATTVTQGFVRTEHRDDLPGVSDWRHTTREQGPLADVVDEAIADLNPDGREVATLRALAAEDSETLSYTQLYAAFSEVKPSRIRQSIGTLCKLGLVATFGPQSDRKAELLEAGQRVLDDLDAEIGRQSRLADAVSDSGNSSPQCRVTPRTRGEGQDGPRPYQVGWMSQHGHAAATACGRNGSVTFVDGRLPDGNGRTHEVSYDPDADEAVVAVQATEPLPYAVSSAVALATPWFVDRVLPPSRLEAIDEPPEILRAARCIGELSDEALADPEVLRDKLVAWGQRIQDLTVDLRNEEYDDRDAFRSTIMRLAHGLAGSIVHLLDVVGVDLAREVRVPSGADRDDLEALSQTIGITAAIQSRYNGVFNGYRQLFEERPEKRAYSFSVDVDAADPHGTLIGSFVFRGTDLHRLRPSLEDRLESPRELHDDAPEFAVQIPVREPGREEIAAVANDTLLPKRIQPTDVGVTLCQTLVPDPFAVARGLDQLGTEDAPRELRVDELRYALGALDAASILPDLPSSASAIVHTLLRTDRPLSQSDLADRADVSTRSVRNHRDVLVALGLLETENGYRLTISFQTSEERSRQIAPKLAEGGSLLEAVDTLLVEYLPPDRYADPTDSLGKALFDTPGDPPNPWLLADHDDLAAWFDVGARLADAEQPADETTVTMGPAIAQQPLPTTGATEVRS